MNTENDKKATSIILETNYTGHRSEYVSHLMKFINTQAGLYGKFVFILDEKMNALLGELSKSPNYSIRYFDFDKKHKNSVARSFWEWNLIAELILELKSIREIMFMDIDPYLVLLISSRFKKLNLSVKGILFQPYVHFKEINGGISFYMKKVFKNYLFQKYSVFINSNIHKIFILNDKNSVAIMNKKIKKVFYNLPDPIENDIIDIDAESSEKIKEKYAIKLGKKNLLLFGSIDDRKNLINIIDSLRLLPAEAKKNIHLIIAGKLSEDVKDKYIEHIEKHKTEVSIAYNNGFVNAREREPLFENCDLVLMPYINFFSASSVLGHTIIHNKNVVVSNMGIIGRFVNEHKVGISVDPRNTNAIKEAIRTLLYNSKEFEYDNTHLVDEFSPLNFSKTILLN